MRVKPSQLVSGCILLQDVMGKTAKPIIPKNVTLTDSHITVLQKFLVETVDISKTLASGEPFEPGTADDAAQQSLSAQPAEDTFADKYKTAVSDFKQLFKGWQNHNPIDITDVRQVLIPLFESIDHPGRAVFTLHQHALQEDYIYHHSVSVGILSAYLAKKMGYDKGRWLQIGLAGALCDCGMARVNDALLQEDRALLNRELKDLKQHPVYGYRMVEKLPALTQDVKVAVLQHHERLDGSGYPLGLKDQTIHDYARIIAVCDLYHAMTCERSYRERQSPFAAIEQLRHDQYTKLDHHIVKSFMDNFVNSSAGATVRLSTGQVGEVVYTDAQQPARPLVRVNDTGSILPLTDYPDLSITAMWD
ncbi:HD-GYP domain-containing protein [Barrientosiimonas marina]|uniref:HD-GYP domain-containing protein n=1 Tax=Lentibacillus kimchii TaxID=1542911 RepID=A0ABW2UT78_9BACI